MEGVCVCGEGWGGREERRGVEDRRKDDDVRGR